MAKVLEAVVEIVSLDDAGDGVAQSGPHQITVPFTIPGERVRVRLGPRRSNTRIATLLEVIRASPHRVSPKCRHFGPCGGCVWQHIAYAEQLNLKTTSVDRIVRAAVLDAPAAKPTLAATSDDGPWRFRNKVHFVFGSDRGRDTLVMGHFARGSRRVVRVMECPVHDERGNAVAFRFRDAYLEANVGAATLKSLVVRSARGTRELMTTLVLTHATDKRVRVATKEATTHIAESSSLHINIHPKPDAFIFGRETRRVHGPERMREEVDGVFFLVSPTAFFQTNIGAAEILVRLVMDVVPPGSRVLDLYAGAGLFALPLARAGNDVVAIEENRVAVADGEASRRLNRIPAERCRFITGSVEDVIRKPKGLRPPPTSYRLPTVDVVILDPSRQGCHPSVLQAVFERLRPSLSVYVSCDPRSLGRDLGPIARAGYHIRSVQPVDMFPHTAHIETVVVLER